MEIDMKKVAVATLILASMLPVSAVLAHEKKDDMKRMMDMCKEMGKDMCKNMDMSQGMGHGKDMDMSKGMGSGKGMEMGKNGAAAAHATHMATGVVQKLNPDAGVVTVAHEPVNSLNWPAMTMGFKLKDKALLAKLKEGQKVDFEFMQEGGDYVVTSVK
jgi:Cu(I)/Ag(I) efflux system periplasmic protein CusF